MIFKKNKQTHSNIRSLFPFKGNKKAVELTLANIVGIILAIIIITGTFYFFFKIGKLFLGGESQRSEASLRRLGSKISELENNQYDIFAALYLDERSVLIGFDKEKFDESPRTISGAYPFMLEGKSCGGIKTSEQYKRPEKCMNKPCLCICKIKPANICTLKEDTCFTLEEGTKIKTNSCKQGLYLKETENMLKKETENLYLCKKENKIYISLQDDKTKEFIEFCNSEETPTTNTDDWWNK